MSFTVTLELHHTYCREQYFSVNYNIFVWWKTCLEVSEISEETLLITGGFKTALPILYILTSHCLSASNSSVQFPSLSLHNHVVARVSPIAPGTPALGNFAKEWIYCNECQCLLATGMHHLWCELINSRNNEAERHLIKLYPCPKVIS